MVDIRNAQVNGISSPVASRGYGHPSALAFRRDRVGIFRRSRQAKLLRRRQRNTPAFAQNAIGRPGIAALYLALARLLQFLAITRGATMANPLMLIHGYGSSGQAFSKWRDAFLAAGRKVEEISVGNSSISDLNRPCVSSLANVMSKCGEIIFSRIHTRKSCDRIQTT